MIASLVTALLAQAALGAPGFVLPTRAYGACIEAHLRTEFRLIEGSPTMNQRHEMFSRSKAACAEVRIKTAHLIDQIIQEPQSNRSTGESGGRAMDSAERLLLRLLENSEADYLWKSDYHLGSKDVADAPLK